MSYPSLLYFRRAKKLADWFVNNQVTNHLDANCGRFASQIGVSKPRKVPDFSTNWTTGMTVISLLMMYKRTGSKRYLNSARLACSYLRSLQSLDSRNLASYGHFREETPQTQHAHPRDALSAAWGMLCFYQVTGDQDALWRVHIFAEWFVKYAVKKNYPAWTTYFEKGKKPFWRLGSFHGGSPLFFFELAEITGEKRWNIVGLKICDAWSKIFIKNDGSIKVEVHEKTGQDLTGQGPHKGHINWQEMHKTNDDFTAMALMRAYKLTGKKSYLDTARCFLNWAISVQRNNGSFSKPAVNSAAATLILELMDFFNVTKEIKYRKAMEKAIPYFISLQELVSKEKCHHGGFYCVDINYTHEQRKELGVRTSSYALATLLRLEGKCKYSGYTA